MRGNPPTGRFLRRLRFRQPNDINKPHTSGAHHRTTAARGPPARHGGTALFAAPWTLLSERFIANTARTRHRLIAARRSFHYRQDVVHDV
jgi:hypothetical protein